MTTLTALSDSVLTPSLKRKLERRVSQGWQPHTDDATNPDGLPFSECEASFPLRLLYDLVREDTFQQYPISPQKVRAILSNGSKTGVLQLGYWIEPIILGIAYDEFQPHMQQAIQEERYTFEQHNLAANGFHVLRGRHRIVARCLAALTAEEMGDGEWAFEYVTVQLRVYHKPAVMEYEVLAHNSSRNMPALEKQVVLTSGLADQMSVASVLETEPSSLTQAKRLLASAFTLAHHENPTGSYSVTTLCSPIGAQFARACRDLGIDCVKAYDWWVKSLHTENTHTYEEMLAVTLVGLEDSIDETKAKLGELKGNELVKYVKAWWYRMFTETLETAQNHPDMVEPGALQQEMRQGDNEQPLASDEAGTDAEQESPKPKAKRRSTRKKKQPETQPEGAVAV